MNQVKVLSRISDEQLAEISGGKKEENVSGAIAKGIIKGAKFVVGVGFLYCVADDYANHYAGCNSIEDLAIKHPIPNAKRYCRRFYRRFTEQ